MAITFDTSTLQLDENAELHGEQENGQKHATWKVKGTDDGKDSGSKGTKDYLITVTAPNNKNMKITGIIDYSNPDEPKKIEFAKPIVISSKNAEGGSLSNVGASDEHPVLVENFKKTLNSADFKLALKKAQQAAKAAEKEADSEGHAAMTQPVDFSKLTPPISFASLDGPSTSAASKQAPAKAKTGGFGITGDDKPLIPRPPTTYS